MSYNFGCVIARETLFDYRSRFSGQATDEDIAKIEGLRDVAMATDFGIALAVNVL